MPGAPIAARARRSHTGHLNGRQPLVLDSGGGRGRHCVFRFVSSSDCVDAAVPCHPRTPFRRSFERFPGLRKVGGRSAVCAFVGRSSWSIRIAVFAAVLTVRFRVADDRSNAASTLVLLAAGIFIVLGLAELAFAIAQTFRRADLDTTGASILFGLSNGIFVVSWSAIAAFLAASGLAALSTRALPPWLGWPALVIGIGLFLAVAAPLSAIGFFPYFLFLVWVLVTSVVLLMRKPTT